LRNGARRNVATRESERKKSTPILLTLSSLFAFTPLKAQCVGILFGAPCSGSEHRAPLNPSGFWVNDHSDCRTCVDPGGMDACHPMECNQGFGAAATKKTYEVAVNAASIDDVRTLVKLGREGANFVTFNPDRMAVQLWNCSGESVISTFLVRDFHLIIASSNLRQVRNLSEMTRPVATEVWLSPATTSLRVAGP
jgi:hypothetical protein